MANLEIPSYFSSVFGIGSPQKVYALKKVNKWGSLVAAVVFLGGAAVVILGGAALVFLDIQNFGSAVTNRALESKMLPALCISGIALLIGLGSAWAAYANWKKSAVLYQNGVAYADRKGLHILPWNDITGMTSAVTKHYRNGIYTGTTHVYTLWKKDGGKFVLNDTLQNVEELGNKVREGIFPHVYQASADRYNAGHPVQFGPVIISKSGGIQIKKKSYQWKEIEKVTVQRGSLKISKKGGGWFSGADIAVSTIPNMDVLFSIINQVVGIKAG